MPSNLCFFAVHADDLPRAQRFYEKVFGWKFQPWGPPGFFLIATGDKDDPGVQGALQQRHDVVPGQRITGYECTIATADIDATAAAVVANGGKVVLPKCEIPTVGWLIKIQDREGNVVLRQATSIIRKGKTMKTISFVLLTIGTLMTTQKPGDKPKSDPSKGDLERLRGTWETVSLVNNGKTLVDEKTPPKEGPATKLVYDGSKWKIKVGDKIVASGIFRIDATKKPKEIDIFDESGAKNDQTKLGIYDLKEDSYKYCLAPAGKPRPTEFASKEGSGHSFGVMKRSPE